MENRKLKDLNRIKRPETIPGVYFLYKGDEIVYIGQSMSIHTRVCQHASQKYSRNNKSRDIMDWDTYSYIRIDDNTQRLIVETEFLQKYNPKYNEKLCTKINPQAN